MTETADTEAVANEQRVHFELWVGEYLGATATATMYGRGLGYLLAHGHDLRGSEVEQFCDAIYSGALNEEARWVLGLPVLARHWVGLHQGQAAAEGELRLQAEELLAPSVDSTDEDEPLIQAVLDLTVALRMARGIDEQALATFREQLALASTGWRRTGAVPNDMVAVLIEMEPSLMGSLSLYRDEEAERVLNMVIGLNEEVLAALGYSLAGESG